MRRGQGRATSIAIVGGLAVLAGGGWLLLRELRAGGASSTTTAVVRDGGVAAARDAASRAPAVVDVGPPRPVPPIHQAPDSPDRPMPYRPAKFLRYSEGVPAKTPADDDASPIVERILAITTPTGEQEAAIRAGWRAHEDGRRELLAKAPPPSIGDPFLDPRQLAELDRAFDELLQNTLRHEQLARLALEMPPPAPED